MKPETYPDLVVGNDSDLRDVSLDERGETDLQLCHEATASPPQNPRLLTPGNKVLVLLHTGHHLVHLLWGVPEHRDTDTSVSTFCFLFEVHPAKGSSSRTPRNSVDSEKGSKCSHRGGLNHLMPSKKDLLINLLQSIKFKLGICPL